MAKRNRRPAPPSMLRLGQTLREMVEIITRGEPNQISVRMTEYPEWRPHPAKKHFLTNILRALNACAVQRIEKLTINVTWDFCMSLEYYKFHLVPVKEIHSQKLSVWHLHVFSDLRYAYTDLVTLGQEDPEDYEEEISSADQLWEYFVNENRLLTHLNYKGTPHPRSRTIFMTAALDDALEFNQERYFQWVDRTIALMVKRRLISRDVMKNVLSPYLIPILERNLKLFARKETRDVPREWNTSSEWDLSI